ncbi:hypothetical protein ACIBBE_48445 [Streptomyces sp. NPDC051644]
MTAKLDNSVSRDVRAAVKGTLHGWLRLHRFQIAIAFPNMTTPGTYRGTEQNALTTQFNRLEADIGHQLFHRSVQTTPQRPTTRGQSLLRQLRQAHAQELMRDALAPDQILPCPTPPPFPKPRSPPATGASPAR